MNDIPTNAPEAVTSSDLKTEWELRADVEELVEALEACLDWMEDTRASTDAGFWEWNEDGDYARGRALLARIERETTHGKEQAND